MHNVFADLAPSICTQKTEFKTGLGFGGSVVTHQLQVNPIRPKEPRGLAPIAPNPLVNLFDQVVVRGKIAAPAPAMASPPVSTSEAPRLMTRLQ